MKPQREIYRGGALALPRFHMDLISTTKGG